MLHSFSAFIAAYLPGKIQKITVNAGFICPNRNGEKGHGGCIYCNNASFTPEYAMTASSVIEQIRRGKEFFSRKYPDMHYIAYFQSYTSTNAPVSQLMEMYREALAQEKVDGLIIGTRPDCMPQSLLDALQTLADNHFIMIEYGAESANDRTLRLINRCHTWADTVDAVTRTADAGIPVGLHLILGLPGEQRNDIMKTIERVNALPVNTVKFHQLQIIKNTTLAGMVNDGFDDFIKFSPETYADLCVEILRTLRPDITVERFISQAPPDMLIYPKWGLKNYQFTTMLENRLHRQSSNSE